MVEPQSPPTVSSVKKTLLMLAAAATVATLAGGCSSSGSSAALPPVTPIPTTHSHHPHPTTSAPATSTPPSSPTTSAPTAQPCASSQLQLSLGETQGEAGSFDTPVILTNTGGAPCTVSAYPGVSYINSSGQQLGPSAARTSGPHAEVITLQTGQAASALLHQTDPGDFDTSTCRPQKAQRLRVYPPGQTVPLSVADKVTVCTTSAGRSTITVLQSGTNPGA